jgi:hypothetical protein
MRELVDLKLLTVLTVFFDTNSTLIQAIEACNNVGILAFDTRVVSFKITSRCCAHCELINTLNTFGFVRFGRYGVFKLISMLSLAPLSRESPFCEINEFFVRRDHN